LKKQHGVRKHLLVIRLMFGALAISALLAGLLVASPSAGADGDTPGMENAGTKTHPFEQEVADSTADHTKFAILQQDFKTAPDVTKACLSCHTQAAQQLMHTTHWTWEYVNPRTGQVLGKRNVINNFCIALSSNWPRCTSCHTGYGWKDNTFDFTNEENVDCLVCHDTTGTYKKFPTGAGHPTYEPKEFPPGSGHVWEPPDLSYVAQHVGPTSRSTCGACHFYGGGGDGVKHGDLDSTLKAPPREVDVHMSAQGEDFTCTTCHTTHAHNVPGSRYDTTARDEQGREIPVIGHTRATCESCHGLAPMKDSKLNDHVDRVACQTCHVPEFARGNLPTKMWWDWSKAGKFTEDGKWLVKKDQNGWVTYHTLKGEFRWAKDVVPDYYWFNGVMTYTLIGDTIDPNQVVHINKPQGSYDDSGARIWPFKVFRGRQPYDAGYNTLVVPHLFGKDDTAYWKNFDWDKAIRAGMASVEAPYSGKYGFVETEMYWPITHMVAPKEEAVQCGSCHSRNGRLSRLTGFYMPGRDRNRALDFLGWLGSGLALAGVLVHGGLRIVTDRYRKRQKMGKQSK